MGQGRPEGQANESDAMLDRLATVAAQALATGAAAVWLADQAGDRLTLAADSGLPPDSLPRVPVAPAESALWATARAAGVAILENASDTCLPTGYPAAASVALVAEGQPVGLLCVYSASPRKFTPAETAFLRSLADLGAAAIQTGRRLAELEQAEIQRGQLMRVTAHELRSPITVAQSLLRNVLRGYAGPLSDLQRDVFGRVAGQLDFLGVLVNDFLDLTASRARRMTADEGPVAVNTSLARVVIILQPRAEEKGVTLTFRQAREELAVWATEEALDHVFTNLVDNAVKYTPPGGTVTVTLSRNGDQAQVRVSDSGIGIPADSLPHLFEEFYRAPNARAFKAVGTGLGLAIVKGLVERYRGRIAVESAVGQGTTFSVDFPLYYPAQ
ncbi:MAG: GAF domain-containing sensor histidine kinase [Chloroflexi bacterium]|nr:GAF domain-containing sensor histidine kinase [Chloroflexota bacterium]